MTTNIYILKLEGGRFYVGKSDNVMKRYQEHLNGSGSSWTKKYKPISLEKTIENASPFDEDRYVKEYMSKYGMEKVRGGAYVLEELPEFQIDALKSELWGSTDKCTKCGRPGHWVKDCYAKTDITGAEIVEEESSDEDIYMCGSCRKSFTNEKLFENHKCVSISPPQVPKQKEEEWECEYCDRTFTTRFGCSIHEKSCSGKNTKKKTVKKQPTKTTGACYRCGRPGHFSPDCYARTHKDGYDLDSDDE